MVWQDVFPLSGPRIDAEQERELRLALQARAGAGWALSALIARYQPPVTRYLTRLTGNAELSQRQAERIFVRMDRRLRGPHGGKNLRLWLLRACTEAGLDTLRHPPRTATRAQLKEASRPLRLLPGPADGLAADRLRAGLEALAEVTGTTSRQVRKLIWSALPESFERPATRKTALSEAEPAAPIAEDVLESQDPREALRYRIIRVVLADLPYGDAQCLALHLIAGLNQAEVALALGITQTATRRRIVHGLQMFAERYAVALASLGLTASAFETPVTDQAVAAQPAEETIVSPQRDEPAAGQGVPDEVDDDPDEQPTLVWKSPYVVTIPPAHTNTTMLPRTTMPPTARTTMPPQTGADMPAEEVIVEATLVPTEAVEAVIDSEQPEQAAEQPEQPEQPYEAETQVVSASESPRAAAEDARPFMVTPRAPVVPLPMMDVVAAVDAQAGNAYTKHSHAAVPLEMEAVVLPEPEQAVVGEIMDEAPPWQKAPLPAGSVAQVETLAVGTALAARRVPVLTDMTDTTGAKTETQRAEGKTAEEQEQDESTQPVARMVPVLTHTSAAVTIEEA